MPEKAIAPGQSQGKGLKKLSILSPAGMILALFGVVIEAVDPLIPGGSLTIELILDAIYSLFLVFIGGQPIQSLLLPFGIERIPIISDIVPTWLIQLFRLFS